jgi:hypothetical protein
MANEKIYLNVPFAEKDAAKALGARWDAAAKKWYAPADKDASVFAQWLNGGTAPVAAKTATASKAAVITYPIDKNFVAYNGDEPPWL